MRKRQNLDLSAIENPKPDRNVNVTLERPGRKDNSFAITMFLHVFHPGPAGKSTFRLGGPRLPCAKDFTPRARGFASFHTREIPATPARLLLGASGK